ncbi:MAG: hypothetical protein TRG1_445 [Flavobacteriaceae bacterium FS1-H7996/R]|nr:MAG: hypothetical protein TRG1_445 [Flavobacteriaceae bacterium FS1-H7996/R]
MFWALPLGVALSTTSFGSLRVLAKSYPFLSLTQPQCH